MPNDPMTATELDAIEARLRAATEGPCVATTGALGTDVRTQDGRSVADDVKRESDADFIAHAYTDVRRLLAEVRRLTLVLKVVVWKAGVDDYEGCTVLRDTTTDAVLGWYNASDYGECIWKTGLGFPNARATIAAIATKKGWEVRDGQ